MNYLECLSVFLVVTSQNIAFSTFACRLRHPWVKSIRNGWHKLNRKLKNCKELMTCCKLSFLVVFNDIYTVEGKTRKLNCVKQCMAVAN